MKNFYVTLAILTLSFIKSNAQVTVAHDTAANYDSTSWVYNSNGGFGMTPWMIWTNGDTDNGTAGHTISSAVADGFGNIDTDGKAFGMYGYPYNGAPQAVGYRFFNNTGATPDADYGYRTPLMPGQVFSIDLAAAYRNGYKGIDLLNTAWDRLWNFGIDSDNRYEVNQESIFDNVYDQHSVFHIEATQLTVNTFSVTVTRGTEVYTSGPFDGSIAGIKFYESSTASNNVLNKMYFNNMDVTKCGKVTTWNGTAWDNGKPNIGVRAIIAGNFTSTEDLFACNLTVTNNAQVVIEAGTSLTVDNDITVADGAALIINSNANLVQISNTAVNTGNVTVKRNSSELFRLDYTLWASPVANQNLLAFSPNTSTDRFYEYKYGLNASTGQMREQYFGVNPATTNFDIAKAYLIRMPNSSTVAGYNEGTTEVSFGGSFTGVPNNGIIAKPISAEGDRYTGTGNPYASAINIHDFFDANADVLDPSAGLYFWRKKNNSSAGTYATITKDAYVYNHAEGGNPGEDEFGGEQWDELFNVTTTEENWVINPGQGFFVRAAEGVANPVLTFNNAMRRGDVHNNQFFRSAQGTQGENSRMWLNLNGTASFSQIAVVYSTTATLGIDAGRDGKQLSASTVSLYTIAQATNLLIQARPAFDTADVVTVGFKVATAGTYTISLHRADGVFVNGQNIYLKDKMMGTLTNISGGDYTFTTQDGTFDNRFEIVYTTDAALGTQTNVLTNNDVVVYQNGGVINVNTGNATINSVTVYTIEGKVLYSNAKVANTQTAITGINAQHEVLIVTVNTDKGAVSKKIVY